jgi:hypothetical protein
MVNITLNRMKNYLTLHSMTSVKQYLFCNNNSVAAGNIKVDVQHKITAQVSAKYVLHCTNYLFFTLLDCTSLAQ